MRHLIILTLLIAAHAAAIRADSITDMGAARDWCDSTMTHRVEGIWEFPEDETRVLVRKQTASATRYVITVVESPDTRLVPGEEIGQMQASPDPTKFEMTLYRTKLKGAAGNPGKCLAVLDEKNDALLVQGRKMKFSLASRWFLPSFWRAVRISVKNPLDALPRGMVRIYPANSRRQPDYL